MTSAETCQYNELLYARDVDCFKRHLVSSAEALGFPLVNATLIVNPRAPGTTREFHSVDNAPATWRSNSSQHVHEVVVRDPVNVRLKTSPMPFTYDQRFYVDAQAGDLWEAQAPFGFKCGLNMAMHLSHGLHVVLGMDRDESVPTAGHAAGHLIANLQLIASRAQAGLVRLLNPISTSVVPHLSSLELDIVRWGIDGRSTWAIGEALCISQGAVSAHWTRIAAKLGCRSGQQALLRAMQLGLV